MSRLDQRFISLDERYGAPNYHPLPVVLKKGKGVYVWDVNGNRYFDMLSAYSALNQGHNHPKIVAAAKAQLNRLTLTSRAFHNALMGPLLKEICRLTRQDKAILMNSGAEAVETAIKAMRLWGYQVKKIPKDRAEIIVCRNNFHGRTTTIVGFSSDPNSYEGFGPKTPGFIEIEYGSGKSLESAITSNTCGFLFEPLQGEAGVLIPPTGYLKEIRALCSKHNVLMCADEIQTGLGRTGKLFCCDHEKVRPDLMILGKALSGGLYPISAVAARSDIMDLFTAGKHGSTFGGNPLASSIGLAALKVIVEERLPQKAAATGEYFRSLLQTLKLDFIQEVRGKGLLIGVELKKPARPFCEALAKNGILAKETHEKTIRFAPPLTITRAQIQEAFNLIRSALSYR